MISFIVNIAYILYRVIQWRTLVKSSFEVVSGAARKLASNNVRGVSLFIQKKSSRKPYHCSSKCTGRAVPLQCLHLLLKALTSCLLTSSCYITTCHVLPYNPTSFQWSSTSPVSSHCIVNFIPQFSSIKRTICTKLASEE